MSESMNVGDRIIDSPVGSGVVTELTERGVPKVNDVAVAWCQRDDDAEFQPHARPSNQATIKRQARSAAGECNFCQRCTADEGGLTYEYESVLVVSGRGLSFRVCDVCATRLETLLAAAKHGD